MPSPYPSVRRWDLVMLPVFTLAMLVVVLAGACWLINDERIESERVAERRFHQILQYQDIIKQLADSCDFYGSGLELESPPQPDSAI